MVELKDNVVAMPGVSKPDEPVGAQPVAEVVKVLEDLLDLARTGNLRAIAFSYIRSNERPSYGWFGIKNHPTRMHILHSGLMTVVTDLGMEIANSSTDVDPDKTAD